jgi:hypothetical protein
MARDWREDCSCYQWEVNLDYSSTVWPRRELVSRPIQQRDLPPCFAFLELVELHQTPLAAAAAAGEELQSSAVEILAVAVEAELQTAVAEAEHQTAVAEEVALQIAAAVVEEGMHCQPAVFVAAAVPKK